MQPLCYVKGSIFPFDNLWGQLPLPFDILRLTRRVGGPFAVGTYLADFPFGRTAVVYVPDDTAFELPLWCELRDSSTSDVLVFNEALRASVEGVAVTATLRCPYRQEVPVGAAASFALVGVPSDTVWRVASTEPVERRRQMDVVITAEIPASRAPVTTPRALPPPPGPPAEALPLPTIPPAVSPGVYWSVKKAYPFDVEDFIPGGVRFELTADGLTQGVAGGRAYVAVAVDLRFTVVDQGYALRSDPELFTRGYDVELGGRTFQVWRALTWEPSTVPYITVRLLDAGAAPRPFPPRRNPNNRLYWTFAAGTGFATGFGNNYYGPEDEIQGRYGLRPGRVDFTVDDFDMLAEPLHAGQGRYRIRRPYILEDPDAIPRHSQVGRNAIALDWRFTLARVWFGTQDSPLDIEHQQSRRTALAYKE